MARRRKTPPTPACEHVQYTATQTLPKIPSVLAAFHTATEISTRDGPTAPTHHRAVSNVSQTWRLPLDSFFYVTLLFFCLFVGLGLRRAVPVWKCDLASRTPLTTLLCSVCSREVLQEVLDADLSNEAFPFSTHKVVNAAGHQVRDAHSPSRVMVAVTSGGLAPPSSHPPSCPGVPSRSSVTLPLSSR